MGATPLPELKNERQKIYLVLEELDFTWDEHDVVDFRDMWNMGIPISWIASHFKRDIDEVAMLVMDQCRKGKIKPRPNGVHGREGE